MMDSEQIFHPRYWFAILGFLTVAFPAYVFVLWKSWKLAIIFLGIFLCFGVYLAFFSARNFGGASGAGIALGGLSLLMIPISIVLWLLAVRPFKRNFLDDVCRIRMFSFGSVIVILAPALAFWGSFAINTSCFLSTQRNAAPLIEAIETYYLRNGIYPPNVTVLTPIYLPTVPKPACSWLSGQENRTQFGYEMIGCPDGSLLLINVSMDGSVIERYQFSTSNWSSINVLEGICSHLP